MLIDIRVKNFRSYKDETIFSLETGDRLSKFKETNTFPKVGKVMPSVVKSAIIFGPNANGKSNVIMAFDLLAYLLKHSTKDVESRLRVDTFGNNQAPTVFAVNFVKDGRHFSYYLEYTESAVIEEYLEVNQKKVLHRRLQEYLVLPDSLVAVSNTFRKNQLLLYLAQSYNHDLAQMAFSWLTKDVVIVRNNGDRLRNDDLKLINESIELKERLLNFMQAADFGILDFEIVERSMPRLKGQDLDDEEVLFEFKQLEILFRHQLQTGTVLLPFSSESEGTRVFVTLAIQLLINSSAGRLMLIDEFERSLHFELAQSLMHIFNNEKQMNQFVLTTHNLDLMDDDLRVDQIWFVEKNEFGESNLYSLFDFKMPGAQRGDYGYKKRYNAGLFGATQIVNQQRLLQNVFSDV
jgi:AAA15 family ATPase/GTPase